MMKSSMSVGFNVRPNVNSVISRLNAHAINRAKANRIIMPDPFGSVMETRCTQSGALNPINRKTLASIVTKAGRTAFILNIKPYAIKTGASTQTCVGGMGAQVRACSVAFL
ncbi:hypothetical protein D3C79_848400 [compost metagenome]